MIDHNDGLLDRAAAALADGSRCWPTPARPGLSGARNTGIDGIHRRHRLLPRRRRGGRARTGARTCWRRTPTRPSSGSAARRCPSGRPPPPAWWPTEFGWVVGCSYRGQPTTTVAGPQPDGLQHVGAPHGPRRGRWLRRRPGSHRGDSPLGCEETELCIRAAELFPDGRLPVRAAGRRAPPRARPSGRPGATSATAAGPRASPRPGWPRRRRPVGRAGERSRLRPAGAARPACCATSAGPCAATWPALARAGAIVAGLGLHRRPASSPTRWTRRAGPPRGRVHLRHPADQRRAEPVLPLVIDLSGRCRPIDARRGDAAAVRPARSAWSPRRRPGGQGPTRPGRGGRSPPEQVGARLRYGARPQPRPGRRRPATVRRRTLRAERDRRDRHPRPARAAGRVPALDLRRDACCRSGWSWWTTPRRPTGTAELVAELAADRAAAALRPRGPARTGPGAQRRAAARAHPARRLHRRRRAGRPRAGWSGWSTPSPTTTRSPASPG